MRAIPNSRAGSRRSPISTPDRLSDPRRARVFDEFGGQGIGLELGRRVLDVMHERRLDPIDPVRPFIARWVKRHKDYQDLLG